MFLNALRFLKGQLRILRYPQTVHFRSQPDKFARRCTSCNFPRTRLFVWLYVGRVGSKLLVSKWWLISVMSSYRSWVLISQHSESVSVKRSLQGLPYLAFKTWLRKFENRKTDRYGFVQFWIHNFGLSERYAAGGSDQTIWVENETDVYTVSDVFHGFSERCACLQFSLIRFKIGLRLASTFVAQFDLQAKPGRLFEGNDSVNFCDF